jgi:hypothetical protein
LLEQQAMTRFVRWAVSAGLVLAVSAAHAQMPVPYRAVSDFQGPDFQAPGRVAPFERPYGAAPPAPPTVYNDGPYGAAPRLLALQEIYAILRDNGFSPLGVPHQRGPVFTVAVLDPNGEDGQLVIDAGNGRIIRFLPAYGYGPYDQAPYGRGFPLERMSVYGPHATLPPPIVIRGTPRPPAPVPQVASGAVPLPTPKPAMAGTPADHTPQQSAAAAPRSAPPVAPHASVAPQGSPTVGEAKPVPVIRPTQEMPDVQGLE